MTPCLRPNICLTPLIFILSYKGSALLSKLELLVSHYNVPRLSISWTTLLDGQLDWSNGIHHYFVFQSKWHYVRAQQNFKARSYKAIFVLGHNTWSNNV